MTGNTCRATVPGCPLCAAAQNNDPHLCDELCEVTGEAMRNNPNIHRYAHEPRRCEHCDTTIDDQLDDDTTVIRLCARGTCELMCCPQCGRPYASVGPAGCPACNGPGWLRRLWYRLRPRRPVCRNPS